MFLFVHYWSFLTIYDSQIWSKSFKFVQIRTYCSVVNVQRSINSQHRYNISNKENLIFLILFLCCEKSDDKKMEENDGNWPTFLEEFLSSYLNLHTKCAFLYHQFLQLVLLRTVEMSAQKTRFLYFILLVVKTRSKLF